MRKDLLQLKSLTVASLKMYYRNTVAIFFSLFIPIFIIVIFGVILGNGNNTKYDLGIADQANNSYSKDFITTLEKTKAFTIQNGSYSSLLNSLKQGNQDLIMVIPKTFIISPKKTSTVNIYYDKSKQNGPTAILIINNILSGYNQELVGAVTGDKIPTFISASTQGIQTNNLNSIDFLIPGIIAFSVMQLGIFTVAFAFTSMKQTGALRRLQATPAKPANFILSQAISRLILALVQVGILLFIGLSFFKMHMYGSILAFFSFIILGAIVFLAIGFAIAGYSKDENQAAPIANLISFPMMFLSGIFFPRSLMPAFLQHVTAYFPLTYLSDALREIANNGTSLLALKTDLIGLIIWAIVCMIIAVRLFKWE